MTTSRLTTVNGRVNRLWTLLTSWSCLFSRLWSPATSSRVLRPSGRSWSRARAFLRPWRRTEWSRPIPLLWCLPGKITTEPFWLWRVFTESLLENCSALMNKNQFQLKLHWTVCKFIIIHPQGLKDSYKSVWTFKIWLFTEFDFLGEVLNISRSLSS